MERREAFLAAWREEFGSEEPPDLEVLQCDDQDLCLERMNFCKRRIQDSIEVLRREGFLLKWLSDTNNIDISLDNENVSLITEVMRVLFDRCSIRTGELHSSEKTTQTLAPLAAVLDDELKESRKLLNDEKSNVLDSSDSAACGNATKCFEQEFSNHQHGAIGGNGSRVGYHVRLNENNPGAAVEIQFELFSKINTESCDKEASSHGQIGIRETDTSLANDKSSSSNEEDVKTEDVSSETESRPDSSSSSTEDMAEVSGNSSALKTNKESPASTEDLHEASSVADRPLCTVFAPFAAGNIRSQEEKGSKSKWHIPHIPRKFRHKHEPSHTHDGVLQTSSDKPQHSENKREMQDELERFEGGSHGDINLSHDDGSHNIVLGESSSTSAINSIEVEGKDHIAVVNEPVELTLRIGMDSSIDNVGTNTLALSSETLSEDTLDNAEESEEVVPDTPDAIEVIGDLLSYLDTVEVISSDEEDTPRDVMALKRLEAVKGTRKQLTSVLSTASTQSADSCIPPWSIDVAVAELGDSSDPEDTHSFGSHTAIDSKSSEKLSSLAGEICAEFNVDDPLPVRPPRRNKSDRRSLRTITFEVQKLRIGDDEVFKPVDDGYEGDQESSCVSPETVTHRSQRPSVEYRKDHLARRSQSDASDFMSRSARDDERQRRNRKARGAHVILDGDNIDFPSSPLSPTFEHPQQQLVENDTEKLQTRKWVISGVLDSEKGYVECLELFKKYMKPLRLTIGTSSQVLTMADFNKIFFKIEELHSIHSRFYNELEARVSYWNDKKIIGDLFITLVDKFVVYRDYILNYKVALETIHKCKASEQFNSIFTKNVKLHALQEETTLEGLFSKPVERVGRYIVVFNDLIKHTPEDHPDYQLLVETLRSTQDFLSRISGDHRDGSLTFSDGVQVLKAHQPFHRVKRDHRLVKDNFVVELSDGVRKFRHMFLFNDVLLCTKRKFSGRHETYVCKWHLCVSDLSFKPTEASEAPQVVPVTSQSELDLLRSRIASLRADIRREQGMHTHHGSSPEVSPSARRKRTSSSGKPANLNKAIERLQRKLAEQEVNLLLAIPSLPLTLYTKQGKTYTLLFKSDVDRADWKDAINPLLQQSNVSECAPPSPFEVHAMLEICKKLRTVKSLGRVSIKEDKEVLNGVLYVYVRSGKGFHRNDLYCALEVDHYGQFIRKAKSKTCKATTDPVWDQDFDIEIEGTHFLKVLVYYKSILRVEELCGQATIDLTKEGVRDRKKKDFTLTLDKQGAISLTVQFNATSHGIQRKRSRSIKGVFGVDIARVCKREMSDIPLIIIGCVREIEKRGLEEVGIYRLSGATSDVRKLKQAFEDNSQSAIVLVSETDIHAVAGLLKMYLRDLPEPLFTDELYPKFVEANVIKEPEEKSRRMLELFDQLPRPNRMTALYLIEHVRKVDELHETNKMNLNNLATVFGPNILRPSSKSQPKSENAVNLALGTLNVMSQVGIFLHLLKSDSVQLRLPEDPVLLSRLDPTRGSQRSLGPDWSDQPDRLI